MAEDQKKTAIVAAYCAMQKIVRAAGLDPATVDCTVAAAGSSLFGAVKRPTRASPAALAALAEVNRSEGAAAAGAEAAPKPNLFEPQGRMRKPAAAQRTFSAPTGPLPIVPEVNNENNSGAYAANLQQKLDNLSQLGGTRLHKTRRARRRVRKTRRV
jgi:hypothetical protein